MKISNSMNRDILVFPARILQEVGNFQGIRMETEKYLESILNNCHFLERKKAETDFTQKQLIPYLILIYKERIYCYRRGALLSESRLFGNLSLGLGGHIEREDQNLFSSSYEEGALRELNEEVIIESPFSNKIAALLNDDSNEVGRLHFGVIHFVYLSDTLVRKREKSINAGKFLTIEEIKEKIEEFENWSKICIQNFEMLKKMA